MSRAIRIHQNGGADVLTLDDVAPGEPGPGEALVRNGAAGVNFIDLHQREGRYPLPALPVTLGMEGAGVVEAVGPGVDWVRPGDRVAYVMGGHGACPAAYADHAVVDAAGLILLPDEISDKVGAAMLLKGLTAHYLVKSSFPVAAGQTILVHAAEGGVGLLWSRWRRRSAPASSASSVRRRRRTWRASMASTTCCCGARTTSRPGRAR